MPTACCRRAVARLPDAAPTSSSGFWLADRRRQGAHEQVADGSGCAARAGPDSHGRCRASDERHAVGAAAWHGEAVVPTLRLRLRRGEQTISGDLPKLHRPAARLGLSQGPLTLHHPQWQRLPARDGADALPCLHTRTGNLQARGLTLAWRDATEQTFDRSNAWTCLPLLRAALEFTGRLRAAERSDYILRCVFVRRTQCVPNNKCSQMRHFQIGVCPIHIFQPSDVTG